MDTTLDLDQRLERSFFDRTSVELAHELLDCIVVSSLADGVVALRISEVEAYGDVGVDHGSHAFRGRTPRNSSLFLPGGHIYVYRSYGIHWCMNLVANRKDQAGGVLLRAGEVIEGQELAMRRRNADGVCRTERDLARGPGRLGSALGITHELDGVDLTTSAQLALFSPEWARLHVSTRTIESSTRTGVAGEGRHAKWRFYLAGDPTVSPHRPSDK